MGHTKSIMLLISMAVFTNAFEYFAVHLHPCKDNNGVVLIYDTAADRGRQLRNENQYIMRINNVTDGNIELDFGNRSDTEIEALHPSAKVTKLPGEAKFQVAAHEKFNFVNLNISGTSGKKPYVTSIVVNDQDRCKEPKQNYFEDLTQGHRIQRKRDFIEDLKI